MRIINIGSGLVPSRDFVETQGSQSEVSDLEFFDFTGRHFSGDWGNLGAEDKASNDYALKHGERILSKYRTKSGQNVYIITEWDRSVTTLLLTDEY